MRPTLELDLDARGKGKIALNDIELPFITALRLEADASGLVGLAMDFHPAATVLRIQSVILTRRTVDGLQEICRQWRKENDERSLTDMNALRAFELWMREQDLAVAPQRGPAAFDRFVEIYREELVK
jgi:hypothetical protein